MHVGAPTESPAAAIGFRARRGQFRARDAIDLRLPDRFRQRLVIVDALRDDPRHPVPAIDAPRLPVTEGTMTVLHADLKDGVERPLSRSLEPQRRRRSE